jgi:hypothetical protein
MWVNKSEILTIAYVITDHKIKNTVRMENDSS